MARKIILTILFILAAVVVAGGIMTYLKSHNEPATPLAIEKPQTLPLQNQTQTSEIQQLQVVPQGQGAQVQIKGVIEHNYNIEHLPNDEGFKIDVPKTQIKQVQRLVDNPHPLIKKIVIREAPTDPTTAEVVFYTEKNVNFLDAQHGDTLTVDFVKTAMESPPVQQESPVAEKPSVKKRKTARSGTSKSSNKTVAKKSRSKKKLKSVDSTLLSEDASQDTTNLDQEADALTPQEKGQTVEELKNQHAINTAPTTTAPQTERFPAQQDETPTVEPDNTAAKPADENDGFDLKDIVKSDDSNTKAKAPPVPSGNANLLDAETQLSMKDGTDSTNTQVASIPQNQKFDLNSLQANAPALQSMNVQRAGDATVVTFNREKAIPYKIFRMLNPSRIVVDFKDAKNQLQSDYPRFSGTKVSRVETRQYAGSDGLLIRVILYVDGAPNFTADKKGNQLVLNLQ